MLIKVSSKDTEVVVVTLSRHVRKLPTILRRSLTWDRGLEMAKHKALMGCQLLENALTHSRFRFEVVACAISRSEICDIDLCPLLPKRPF
jgi:hypothetical protein